jgi:serine/threonine protein kinase
VFTSKEDNSVCYKVFEQFKDKDGLLNADCEYKVAQLLKGHPNIVQIESFRRGGMVELDGAVQTRDFMIMEHCENGDLYDFINKYTLKQSQVGLA